MEPSERREPWAGDFSQAGDAALDPSTQSDPQLDGAYPPGRAYRPAVNPQITGSGPRALSEMLPEAAEPTSVDRQAALRALRNLEATEARLERNARREIEGARGKLVMDLLPVLDNLDRTIRAAETSRSSDPAMLEGVRMVRKQLDGVLRGYGVERIDAIGERFDPTVHEAVGMIAVSDPQQGGVVVDQIEPGYRFGDRLLRAAKVNVGKLVAPLHVRSAFGWR